MNATTRTREELARDAADLAAIPFLFRPRALRLGRFELALTAPATVEGLGHVWLREEHAAGLALGPWLLLVRRRLSERF